MGTAVQATWTYVYNARGQVLKVTDANGKATDYNYNAAGFLTSITEPADAIGGVRPVRTFEFTALGRLSAVIDASGHRTTFGYDSRGRLVSTTFPDLTTEILSYGTGAIAGLLASRTDRNGIVEQYEYDATRRRTKIIRAVGRAERTERTFEYLSGSSLTTAETTAGERVQFTYDERQRATARRAFVNTTASLTTQNSWDTLDRLTVQTDPYGRRTFQVFDANDRIVRTVRESVPGGVPANADPAALPRILTENPPYDIVDAQFDAMDQPISTTDGRGFVTIESFDGQGRRTVLRRAAGSPEERKTVFEYDPVGNITKRTEPRTFREGQTFQTVFGYTARNLLASVTEAAGSPDAATVSYSYNLTGKVASMTDARGGVTSHGYDTCDRLISLTNPAGFTTLYGYDGEGNRTSVSNPIGASTAFTYDGHNRLTTDSNPLGQTSRVEYDDDLTDSVGLDGIYIDFIAQLGFGPGANGFAVRRTNAANESTVIVNDGTGRAVLEISSSGGATFTTHDTLTGGLVETAARNPVGAVIRRRVDGAGRPRVLVDGDGKITTRTFDPSGNLVSERDATGVGRDCQFDGIGQPTLCTDTQGDTTTSEYDAAGNEVATTDGAGARKTCAFDFRNRGKSCVDGIGATVRRTYDGNSNVTSITDGDGRVTRYTYDPSPTFAGGGPLKRDLPWKSRHRAPGSS